MSLWDGIIVLLLAVAIFQGYRRGFLLRMTGWVGGVMAFFLARPLSYLLDGPVSKVVNGEATIAKWLQEKFITEHSVADFINGKNIYQWLDQIEELKTYRMTVMENLEKTSNNMYSDMTNAISHTIAVPIWQLVLTLMAWLAIMFLFVFLGRFIYYFLDRMPIFSVIDSFVGAFISLIAIFAVLIAINTLALNAIPEGTAIGDMLHQSYFAPFFKNIFDLFIVK